MKALNCLTGVLLTFLLVGIVAGSSMNLQVEASGTNGMTGSTDLVWMITSNGTLTNPFLTCGQELVIGASSESYVSSGPTAYQGSLDLNNSDIIHMTLAKEFAGSNGVYENSLYYAGYGAGAPAGGCNAAEVAAPDLTNSTNITPAQDAYNLAAFVSTQAMGSDLRYSSLGGINAWASDAPDEFVMDWKMTGDGFASSYMGSFSQTSNGGGPGVLGYQNAVSSRTNTFGKFVQVGTARYSSFKSTFDIPLES